MTEQQNPEPQRSMETTLALHNVISTISERISEKGGLMYGGAFNTGISHRLIFPTSDCQADFVMTFMDNVVGDAIFECKNGCTYEVEMMDLDGNKWKDETSTYSISFDEVGFGSPIWETPDDGSDKVYLDSNFIATQIDRPQLGDEDLQDLIQDQK